jgi:hypothetical protein
VRAAAHAPHGRPPRVLSYGTLSPDASPYKQEQLTMRRSISLESSLEAAGGTAPTKAQLDLLGLTGVTPDNLTAVHNAIAATADDGTGADTLGELQAVVTAAVTAAQKGSPLAYSTVIPFSAVSVTASKVYTVNPTVSLFKKTTVSDPATFETVTFVEPPL